MMNDLNRELRDRMYASNADNLNRQPQTETISDFAHWYQQGYVDGMRDRKEADIDPTHQFEVLVWKKYPENKPHENRWYLVDEGTGLYQNAYWRDTDFIDEAEYLTIVAFAKSPKGYDNEVG